MRTQKRILFVIPYPLDIAPSQRFRFEQYLKLLEQKGASVTIKPFVNERDFYRLYHSGNVITKLWLLFKGLTKRILLVPTIGKYHFVFVHREATPVGPPLFEFTATKIWRKKLIYDFDDAIWLTDSTKESWLVRVIRYRKKVAKICRWSYKVSTGNEYLANYARQFAKNVVLNPTTIDTEFHHNPKLYEHTHPKSNKIIVGWTGSHSTLKYLEQLQNVLVALQQKHPQMAVLVVADRPANLLLDNMIFKKWNSATEIGDLMDIDIGLMPLPDDEWTRGKCGFKALQYMALQKPAVVSPVGVNTTVVSHNVDGLWATGDQEWFNSIDRLLINKSERDEMGRLGRIKVVDQYSVLSNSPNFLRLFQ